MNLLAFALGALVPVMIGPLPADPAAAITARLCNGGTITIPIGGGPPAQDRDCHPEACHAGTCREKNQIKHPKRSI